MAYVPVGTLAAYKAAKYWKDYKLLEKENCASNPSRFVTDDSIIIGRERKYSVVLMEKPQTQTFDGRKYLTDEAFYNSLISGGVEWEPLNNE